VWWRPEQVIAVVGHGGLWQRILGHHLKNCGVQWVHWGVAPSDSCVVSMVLKRPVSTRNVSALTCAPSSNAGEDRPTPAHKRPKHGRRSHGRGREKIDGRERR